MDTHFKHDEEFFGEETLKHLGLSVEPEEFYNLSDEEQTVNLCSILPTDGNTDIVVPSENRLLPEMHSWKDSASIVKSEPGDSPVNINGLMLYGATTTAAEPTICTNTLDQLVQVNQPVLLQNEINMISDSDDSDATSTIIDRKSEVGHTYHGVQKTGRASRTYVDKESDEYKERRKRNNVAVRKSRAKAREKNKKTEERVKQLADENKSLQEEVTRLKTELGLLKDLLPNFVPLTIKEEINRELSDDMQL